MDDRPVLVVDDDPDTLELIRLVLEGELGIRMVLVGDGCAAPRQARQVKPAVVLLDLALPLLDGREVARRLKADPATRDSLIVALTALPRAQEEVLRAGCDDVLYKPFDIDSLIAKVQRHLLARAG